VGSSHRSQKVADRIKVVVAGLLEGKIKDPRLGFVTVTDARVTGDLQHASIFYTVSAMTNNVNPLRPLLKVQKV